MFLAIHHLLMPRMRKRPLIMAFTNKKTGSYCLFPLKTWDLDGDKARALLQTGLQNLMPSVKETWANALDLAITLDALAALA